MKGIYIRIIAYSPLYFPLKVLWIQKVNKLARYRSSKSGKAGKNAARDFHRLLHRDGKPIPCDNIHTYDSNSPKSSG